MKWKLPILSILNDNVNRDERGIDDLRILAYIELYLNSEFYAKHPSFVKVMNSHSGIHHTWHPPPRKMGE